MVFLKVVFDFYVISDFYKTALLHLNIYRVFYYELLAP